MSARRLFPLIISLFFLVVPSASAQTPDSLSAPSDTSRYALGAATVTATRLVFVTKKDTIIYNMDALGATRGDMLRDMISRMPGLELRDGVLYFKGRRVTRLLVNGYDFKRGDTQKALDNLPAYIIKSVKAYEGQTDQHRITGIDDGVKEQVVDVVLRREYLGTWTGNADLGYGTDNRYRYRLFANTFTDNMRVSAYGGYTNTGQYQSANSDGRWSDNGGAGGSSGDTRYLQPGFSTMWHNKVHRDSVGYFNLETSFDYDFRGHNDTYRSGTETYLSDNTNKYSLTHEAIRNDEKILRPQFTIEWNAWKNFYAQLTAQYNFQRQTERASDQSGTWSRKVDDDILAPLDSLLAHAATGYPEESAVNLIRTESAYAQKQHYVSANYYLTQKLTQRNLRLAARGMFQYEHLVKTTNDLKAYTYYQASSSSQLDPLYNRYYDNRTRNTYSQTFLDLNVPVPFLNTLRFTYGYEYAKSVSSTQGFRLERLGDVFAQYDSYLQLFGTLPATADWRQLARDAEISLNSNTLSRTHWAEIQFQYDKNNLYASVQNTAKFMHNELYYLKGDYDPQHPSRNATDYLLNSQLRYTTDSLGRFTLSYFFQRTPASINNYINIPDRSDPLNVTLGSTALHAMRTHRLSFDYDVTFPNYSSITFQTSYSKKDNLTRLRSTYDKETGVTTSQSVNVDGAWDYSASIDYTRTLGRKKRVNMSIYGNYLFSNTPNYSVATSGEPVLRNDKVHSVYVTLNLNASVGNVFCGFVPTVVYSLNRSSLSNISGTHQCTAFYSAYLSWKLPHDFTFYTNANLRHYITSTARQFHNVRTVWNVHLTKSLLRDKSLALQLELSDILNQRNQNNVVQTTTDRAWLEASCVARFLMLHVIYRFSTKKHGS